MELTAVLRADLIVAADRIAHLEADLAAVLQEVEAARQEAGRQRRRADMLDEEATTLAFIARDNRTERDQVTGRLADLAGWVTRQARRAA